MKPLLPALLLLPLACFPAWAQTVGQPLTNAPASPHAWVVVDKIEIVPLPAPEATLHAW